MTHVETVSSGYEAHPTTLDHASGMLVRGEVDLSTEPDLSERLDVAIRESDGTFVVDLSDLTFLDSTGITVLLRARALLGREERQLAIICPPGAVRRVFELTGCGDLFVLFDSRADAAAAGVGA